jgi:hypothetical protein
MAMLSSPPNRVSIIITDSKNAQTLIKNCYNKEEFTQRKQTRELGQGISQSLFNMVNKIFEQEEPLTDEDNRKLKVAEAVLNEWAEENESTSENRAKFNKDMIEKLGRFIIVRVYSHQDIEKSAVPNNFTCSANIIADKATHLARMMPTYTEMMPLQDDSVYIPPFSNRFVYTIEGRSADKGAVQQFKKRMDMELLKRLQHRSKQGLLYRLISQCGLKMDELSEKSTYRNVIKGTDTSWSRTIYKDKELKDQIIQIITSSPSEAKTDAFKEKLILCPFCQKEVDGDLEHMHCYCTNREVTESRNWANEQCSGNTRRRMSDRAVECKAPWVVPSRAQR